MVSDSKHSTTSRRRVLKTAGVAGTVGLLAGCSGDGSDGGGDGSDGGDGNDSTGNGSGDGGGGGMADAPLRTRTKQGNPANQAELNPWADASNGWMINTATIFGARFSITGQEYVPIAFKDWEVKNDELHITLQDGMQWSNGQKITAESQRIFWELDRHMLPEDSREENPPDTGWRTDGDLKFIVELNAEQGYNPEIMKSQYLQAKFHVNHHKGGPMEEYLNKLKDASGDEAAQIRKQVTESSFKYPDVVISSPYVPETANRKKAKLSLNEEHSFVEKNKINWGKGLRITFFGQQVGNPTIIGSDEIDLVNEIVPPAQKPPENLANVLAPEYGGISLAINYGFEGAEGAMEIFHDYRVRQALAYVFDRTKIASNAMNNVQVPLEVPSGLLDPMAKDLYPDLYQNLNPYERTEENMSKANQLMKDAGCTKKGGTWRDPDGKALQLPIIAPPWSEWPGAGQGMVSQMQNFGIKAELVSLDGTTFGSRLWGSHDYKGATGQWGGGPSVAQAWFDQFDPTGMVGAPETFPAPEEVGNPDSEVVDWNTYEILTSLRRMQDPEKIKQEAKKLVWVFNFAQPQVALIRDTSGTMANTKHYDYPEFPEKQGQYYQATSEAPSIWGINTPSRNMLAGVDGGAMQYTGGL